MVRLILLICALGAIAFGINTAPFIDFRFKQVAHWVLGIFAIGMVLRHFGVLGALPSHF
jgi:hypothetical protein